MFNTSMFGSGKGLIRFRYCRLSSAAIFDRDALESFEADRKAILVAASKPSAANQDAGAFPCMFRS